VVRRRLVRAAGGGGGQYGAELRAPAVHFRERRRKGGRATGSSGHARPERRQGTGGF
jgi:hypothetical protein